MNIYRSAYFLMLLFLGLLMYSLQPAWAANHLLAPPLKWAAKELVGCRLELIDDTDIQSFYFSSDGSVSANTGTKNGGVAAPVFYWLIDKQGVLHIRANPKPPGNVLFRITKLKARKNRIVTDCNGKERTYLLTKPK